MKVIVLALASVFGITAVACDDADQAVDCAKICDRYKDCYDSDYDTDECRDRCDNDADEEAYQDKADACESCLDDKSCTESFACASECSGILP